MKLLQGGSKKMEKILTVFGVFGISLIIAGTLTACSANKETTIQNAASQVEISTETNVDQYTEVSLPEEVINGERLPTETEMESLNPGGNNSSAVNNDRVQNAIDNAESKMVTEALQYWEANKGGDLAVSIANGLEYSEFEKTYLLYRAGMEDIMSADKAFEFTLLEVNRLYGETASDYVSLDTAENMVKNTDGTYSFSEEFIGTITSYDYLDGATEAEINDFLDFIAPMIEGLDGQGVHDFMAMFTGSLHQENVTITESQTGQTQNQGNQSNQNNGNSNTGNSNSGNSNNGTGNSNPTPPANDSNEGDGTFSFSDEQFGGGGQGDIPDGFTGIH